MALTSVRVENGLTEDKWGKAKIMLRAVTFDSSYPTGGEPLSPSAFGLKKIHSVVVHSTSGYFIQYNRTTGTLMVFEEEAAAAGGPLVQVAAATDLSAVTADVLAIGWA